MNHAWTIAWRELRSFFRVPMGWVIIALYLVLAGYVFGLGVVTPGGPASLRDFFLVTQIFVLILTPAISMRLISDELRSGTFESLMTAPVADAAVVAGKYLGAVLFLGAMLAPTLVYVAVLFAVSDPAPDPGPIAAGYLSLMLVGMLYLAVGTLRLGADLEPDAGVRGHVPVPVPAATSDQRNHRAAAGGGGVTRSRGAATTACGLRQRRDRYLPPGVLPDRLGLVPRACVRGRADAEVEMSIPHHSPTSTGRRLRFGAMSSVLIAAATVSLVIANLLAARFPARLDVTEMREHRLSPRSQALIAGLTDEYEIVIAAPLKDRRLIDPHSVERAADVLDQFRLGAAKARFKGTWIDTGSPAGMKAYDDLLKRLVNRDANRIKKQADAAASAIAQTEAIATWLESLSPRLQAIRDAIPSESPNAPTNKAYFEQRATESRVSDRSLRELAGVQSGHGRAHRSTADPGRRTSVVAASAGPERPAFRAKRYRREHWGSSGRRKLRRPRHGMRPSLSRRMWRDSATASQ